MRNTFANTFYEAAKTDERLTMVVADISPAGAMDKFRQEYPDRFVNTGVAEQIMIGMVAGMAMRDLRPFAYTIATFSLYRPFEFIRDDLCYQNLPVTIVGIGGGLVYSTLGSTHHAIEDISLARALPNMSVIAPCDPFETKAATEWCIAQATGPTYLRLGKAGEPSLSEDTLSPFEYGKIRVLRDGNDVCILGYGPILKLALEASDELASMGISASVVSIHTLKPLDSDGIVSLLDKFDSILTVEEMVSIGGLGESVKALAWEKGLKCRLSTMSLKDQFVHTYGSHDDLLRAHGITRQRMVQLLSENKR